MNEDLKRNPEKAMLLFTKVYIYGTNTKKPWDKLNKKEMNKSTFKWECGKWFFLSKHHPTKEQVIEHIKSCPELVEDADNILKNNKRSEMKAHFYHIYESYPLRNEEQLKLLLNTIGVRMLHFINN